MHLPCLAGGQICAGMREIVSEGELVICHPE